MTASRIVSVVNHFKRQVIHYEITPEVEESLKGLAEIMSKGPEPAYSLGFQRLMQLTAKRRHLLERAILISDGINSQSQEILKKRLASMSEEEFHEFRKIRG